MTQGILHSASVRLPAAFVLSLCSLAGVACSGKVTDRDVTRISLPEVARPIQKGDAAKSGTLIIDARSPEKFAEGHIPGARNIRPYQVDPKDERDPALDRYKTLIVYDENPRVASGMALAKRLMVARYDDVRLFQEGFEAWRAAGLPVETSPSSLQRR
jgi:rhodanese-related sulfurtransferase